MVRKRYTQSVFEAAQNAQIALRPPVTVSGRSKRVAEDIVYMPQKV